MPNKARDYGDLRVTMTSEWEWRWNDRGTGATRAIDVYHAKSQGELLPLGSFVSSTYIDGNAKGKPAFASPTGYTLMWNDKGGDGKFDGSFWRPTAPAGYVSVGNICTSSYKDPSSNEILCVREDLAIDSDYEPASLWDDRNSGAKLYASVWAISRPVSDRAGTEVLGLPCPREFTRYDTKTPEFTKDNFPRGGDKFSEQKQTELVLPYTAFFPSSERRSLSLIDDPFISLSRHIAWEVYTTHTNNSAGEITDKTTITKGISQTDTTEMSHSAGADISASYGIGSFGGSISLNYQFTATNTNSFNEYKETSREQGFTVKPYQACVYLVRHVWIKSRRSNGSSTLAEIGYNMNEDIILVGVDLKA
ncbi:hypothetical protein GT037_001437 [Alternaria burnsii]|uniref:Insecticidal crystal toxin domain-containing protein n=1 Tax=Alternaria burnsii TaxID=1187904 RepID=A0A8H7EI94_9PLEO|nr:uncharacterized protein GT037_001437 [Alternaria burnsii]KAF7679786.1 hypothetical protein GT037_001437 [Alternaria burnsii]